MRKRKPIYLLATFGFVSASFSLAVSANSTRGADVTGMVTSVPMQSLLPKTSKVSRINGPVHAAVPAPAPASVLAPAPVLVAPPPAPALLPPLPQPNPGAIPRKIQGSVKKSVVADEQWLQLYEKGEQLYQSRNYKEAYAEWALSLAAANGKEVWNQAMGANRIEILKKLALMHKTQNQPAEAAQMYNLAIQTAVKIYGKESAPVAALMLDEGRLYIFSDQIKNSSKANEFMTEAFRINEKLYGRFTIPTGDVAIAIAQLKEREKLFEEALPYWQLAIDIGDRCEPDVISCCRIGPRQGKARCLDQIGKLEDAIAAHKDLIAMCRKGAQSMMPTVLNDYATYLSKAGHATEANAVATESLTFKK